MAGISRAYKRRGKGMEEQVLALAPSLWLDANAPNILFQDSAMTTPATATNDPIGAWKDRSGNNRHLTQGTAGSRPVLTKEILSGKNGITFNGTSHVLKSGGTFGTDAGLNGDPSFTVFFVYKKTDNTLGNAFGWGDQSAIVRTFGLYDQGVALYQGYQFAGTSEFNTTIPAVNTWYLRTARKTPGAINTTMTSTRNGANDATGTPSSLTLNISGGFPFSLGTWANSTSPLFQGSVVEFLIFNTALTVAQSSDVSFYLNSKWSVY